MSERVSLNAHADLRLLIWRRRAAWAAVCALVGSIVAAIVIPQRPALADAEMLVPSLAGLALITAIVVAAVAFPRARRSRAFLTVTERALSPLLDESTQWRRSKIFFHANTVCIGALGSIVDVWCKLRGDQLDVRVCFGSGMESTDANKVHAHGERRLRDLNWNTDLEQYEEELRSLAENVRSLGCSQPSESPQTTQEEDTGALVARFAFGLGSETWLDYAASGCILLGLLGLGLLVGPLKLSGLTVFLSAGVVLLVPLVVLPRLLGTTLEVFSDSIVVRPVGRLRKSDRFRLSDIRCVCRCRTDAELMIRTRQGDTRSYGPFGHRAYESLAEAVNIIHNQLPTSRTNVPTSPTSPERG